MNTKRKIKWIVLGVSVFVLVAWGILMWALFHNNGDDKDNSGRKVSGTETPSATPTNAAPEGYVLLWLKEKRYGGAPENAGKITAQYRYDEYGRCIERIYPGEEQQYSYRYDEESGLVTEVIEYVQNTYDGEGGELWSIDEKDYDVDGNLRREAAMRKYPEDEDYRQTMECTYSPGDGCVEEYYRQWDEYGVLELSTHVKRDNFGNPIYAEKMENPQNPEESSWMETVWNETDAQGRLVRVYSRNTSSGKAEILSEYTYHEDGAITIVTAADYTMPQERLEIDSQGRLVEFVYYQNGNIKGGYVIEYYTYEDRRLDKFTYITGPEKKGDGFLHLYDSYGSGIMSVGLGEDEVDNPPEYTAERDANGRVTRETLNGNTVEFTYDENGNVIHQTTIGFDGIREDYEYRYISLMITEEQAKHREQFWDPMR